MVLDLQRYPANTRNLPGLQQIRWVRSSHLQLNAPVTPTGQRQIQKTELITKRESVIAFILVKLSHIELALPKLQLASKPQHSHSTAGSNANSASSFLSQETLSPQRWLAYWLPQLSPLYPQLCEESLQRKEQAEKEHHRHTTPTPTPCNVSTPRADSHSAQPRLTASSQGHSVCLVSNASPMHPPRRLWLN